jgi:DinB superfamily
MHWTAASPGTILASKEVRCMNALDVSKQQVLKTMTDGGIVIAHATAARMVAVHTLAPAPRDPVRHLQEAHAQARTHLARLTVHEPSREIPSFMTNELFSRLTDAQPRPLTPPAGVGRYTYTPRKVLRRVLDHSLDHLNQIDQWLAWQRDGVVPTPTDGWVGSTVTLPGDLLPLSSSDLDAWLWRIDQAARLVRQRAAELTEAKLDWQPPDGGWPLRRVLHHLARSERLYAASIDEALPGDDPTGRYEEACWRLDATLRRAIARDEDAAIVYAGLYGVLQSREEVVDWVLTIESELLSPRTE